jgi:hypothetical protein
MTMGFRGKISRPEPWPTLRDLAQDLEKFYRGCVPARFFGANGVAALALLMRRVTRCARCKLGDCA